MTIRTIIAKDFVIVPVAVVLIITAVVTATLLRDTEPSREHKAAAPQGTTLQGIHRRLRGVYAAECRRLRADFGMDCFAHLNKEIHIRSTATALGNRLTCRDVSHTMGDKAFSSAHPWKVVVGKIPSDRYLPGTAVCDVTPTY